MEQNPDFTSDKQPDYLTEGRIFDCYAPSDLNPDRIRNSVSRKVREGQADRIVLNLDDTEAKPEEIRDVLERKPVNDLKEIIVIRNGEIIPFFP